ncbi:hypothetical protein [Alicyclobacillus ferrooxydans]|uniref:Uncharacterized protein n=1 Tax=Alicyclobacillus ferrooxydans TaxID=471514 RepID=A0A0P9CUI2_9BACL|nr:hypothetical protein [Alicyclobacillus ferrooxydans]KPV43352.1 hypothetical protein AN477_12960 [Alicyclobacillus ferrooxydans]
MGSGGKTRSDELFQQQIGSELNEVPSGWSAMHEQAVWSALDEPGDDTLGTLPSSVSQPGQRAFTLNSLRAKSNRRFERGVSDHTEPRTGYPRARHHTFRRGFTSAVSAFAAVCIFGIGLWWAHNNRALVNGNAESQTRTLSVANQFQLTFHEAPYQRYRDHVPNLGTLFRVTVTNWPLGMLPNRGQVWLFPTVVNQSPKQVDYSLQSGAMPSWDPTIAKVLISHRLPPASANLDETFIRDPVTSSHPFQWSFTLPRANLNPQNVRVVAVAIVDGRNDKPEVLWSKVFTPSDPLAESLQTSLQNQYPGKTVTNLQVQSEQADGNGLVRYLLYKYQVTNGSNASGSSASSMSSMGSNGSSNPGGSGGPANGPGTYEGVAMAEWNGKAWHVDSTETRKLVSQSASAPANVFEMGGTLPSGKDYTLIAGTVRDPKVDTVWITLKDGKTELAFVDNGCFTAVGSGKSNFANKIEGDDTKDHALFTMTLK